MKTHIARLRELSTAATQSSNPLALAHSISDVAAAMADALAALPACTDCGSKQGAALKKPRSAAAKTPAVSTTPAV
ncbi:hypothetical protein GN316_03100 [Xylophilus sp. Kf1]|nr:hypothetical protein [Xylophilus sp. Kf1]